MEPIIYGPKYGSHDTVGVGVTLNGDVYFTLNGVLLPLVETSFKGLYRIALEKDDNCEMLLRISEQEGELLFD